MGRFHFVSASVSSRSSLHTPYTPLIHLDKALEHLFLCIFVLQTFQLLAEFSHKQREKEREGERGKELEKVWYTLHIGEVSSHRILLFFAFLFWFSFVLYSFLPFAICSQLISNTSNLLVFKNFANFIVSANSSFVQFNRQTSSS